MQFQNKFIIISLFFVGTLLQSNLLIAGPACAEPQLILSTNIGAGPMTLCHNIDDVICRDVAPELRRGCNDSEQSIFSKPMNKSELFMLTQKCFNGVFNSVDELFTEFLPALLKGIWSVMTNASVEGVTQSSRGLYESTLSVASDVYEMAKENPANFMQKQLGKLSDIIGPTIANYDCLKTDAKVEKTCKIITTLLFPPVLLAKVIVKGASALKELSLMSRTAKGSKAISYSFKINQEMNTQMLKLGYTSSEIDQLINKGLLSPEFVSKLNPVNTPMGLKERLRYIDEKQLKKDTAEAARLAAAQLATQKELALRYPVIKVPKKTDGEPLDFTISGKDYRVLKTGEDLNPTTRVVKGPFSSKYLEVPTVNSSGATIFQPIEIESRMSNGSLVVRFYDKEKKTFEGKIVTPAELMKLKVREAPALGKDIEVYKKDFFNKSEAEE